MIQILRAGNHYQPFRGPFTITRVQPSDILNVETNDTAFGPLSTIDHAVMIKGLTIKMHEHVTDLENVLPPFTAIEDTTVVLFVVDMDAVASKSGTISGMGKPR